MKKNDYNYFEALSACAAYGSEAAASLDDTLRNFDEATFIGRMNAMHMIENNADMKKHELMEHLAHEFVTPIDREDIVALSQELDNVVDSIDDVMRRLYMFNITDVSPAALEFSALIVRCTAALESAIRELSNFRKSKTIGDHIVEVNTLESEGDHLHAHSMRALFTQKEKTRNVFLWMQLYECLESCLDACENAGDVAESVIMKNS